MKASLDSKAANTSGKCSLKTGSLGVKNCTKRTNRWNHKTRGCGEELLADKENHFFPSKESVRLCPELPDKDTFLMEKREALKFHPGQTLASSAKIKLQLFPINNETRLGLEKDGHNPHLELTLRGQKKISSVLKHLEKKWGSSSIAKGDPMLFPYNIMDNLSNCIRWTINDGHTTAAAVYTAVGSPAIFRLKYGWFYIHEPRSFGIPSTPVPNEPTVQPGGTEGGCNANLETSYDECDKVEVTSKEYKVIDVGDAANEVVAQKMTTASVDPPDIEPRVSDSLQQPSLPWVDNLTNISIGGLLSEASLQGRFSTPDPKSFGSNVAMQPIEPTVSDSLQQPSLPWVDSLTNISIGGLLSEASLQGRFSTPDPKSFGSNVAMQPIEPRVNDSLQHPSSPWVDSLTNISIGGLLSEASLQGRFSTPDPKSFGSNLATQPSQIISDSLDAFIAAQISHPPVPRLSAEGLHTSILDAEETCHAFPLKKLSSPAAHVQTVSGNINSVACSEDVSSNSLKLPTDKVNNDQDGLSQNPPSGKTQTDLLLSSRLYEDERSLGLTGIKWNDSLGPFDLGAPAKNLIDGDSGSIGGFVKQQLRCISSRPNESII